MSGATTFDTHRFVKNLTASGFTEAQAEAIMSVVRAEQGNLVTTPVLKAELSVLKTELAALETRLTLRMLAIVSAGIAILAALERFSG